MGKAGLWLIVAGLYGAMGVAAGAWASHGLAEGSAEQRFADMASRYQLLHAAVLAASCALPFDRGRGRLALTAARALFTLGALSFCGTLYSLALGFAAPFPGAAPLGGSMLIGGWLCLAAAGAVGFRRDD
jgi:uncharacterized membrane protein YgdD (TMEM256/DUF423 family)